MIRDFIAIDFETANQHPSSVCSLGVVMVRGGQIVDSFYSLIQPEPNFYSYFCQRVHGITQSDTDDAPVFSKVWQQLEGRIVDIFFPGQELDDMRYQIATIPFVAHNARFDEGCLKAVFRVYQMDYPDYRILLLLPADMTYRTITMHWQMQKPVPPSLYSYYNNECRSALPLCLQRTSHIRLLSHSYLSPI